MSVTRLVVTGGVATGKSSFLQRLARRSSDLGLFDCDEAVHQLLTERPVLTTLRAWFGDSVFDGEILDRSALRQVVFADESCRRQLETLLHPKVRSRCEECFADYAAKHPRGLFIADVPLYFETHGSFPNDMVAVVATTPMTQEKRLRQRSHVTQAEAEAIIRAQMPIGEKVCLADVLIWNEGPIARLDDQTTLFLNLFPEWKNQNP